MDKFDIRSIIPMLAQFGIRPDQLEPEKLDRLLTLADEIKDPANITPEIAGQVMQIVGMGVRGSQKPIRRKKIGRNEKCPCLQGRKYKYCCGAN